MNSKTQAQKGFKTFILTLAISLAVFSGIYYIINANGEDIESPVARVEQADEQANVLDASVVEESDEEQANKEEQAVAEEAPESVFGDLASRRGGPGGEEVAGAMNEAPEEAVLAGADEQVADDSVIETTESTVPDTGLSGPTVGIILTLVILSLIVYLYFVGPRKLALSSFEKDLLDDLD